jgi:hypothetical protein
MLNTWQANALALFKRYAANASQTKTQLQCMPKLRNFTCRMAAYSSASKALALVIFLATLPLNLFGLPLWVIALAVIVALRRDSGNLTRLRRIRNGKNYVARPKAYRWRRRSNTSKKPTQAYHQSSFGLLCYRSPYRFRLRFAPQSNGACAARNWIVGVTGTHRSRWQWIDLPRYLQGVRPEVDEEGFRYVEFNIA